MKSLLQLLFFSMMLALTGCGKNNESGKGGSTAYSSSYCVSWSQAGTCSQYQQSNVGIYNSGYSIGSSQFGNVSLNMVQQQNPCILGQNGIGFPAGVTSSARTMFSRPVQMNSIVPQGDILVGVTSFGDVAALIGNGTSTPTFVAYLCPRPISIAPQIVGVSPPLGSTMCAFKYLIATLAFPGNGQYPTTYANFRPLSPGGSSNNGMKFSFCAQ